MVDIVTPFPDPLLGHDADSVFEDEVKHRAENRETKRDNDKNPEDLLVAH